MSEIFLVRHGETFAKTADNPLGVPFVCGSGSEISRNTPLTENGKQGMFKVGEQFKNTQFDIVVISDLVRSRESAEEFLKGAGQENLIENIIVEPRVTEIDYGEDDGVSEEKIKDKKKIFFSDPTKSAIDYDTMRGGETFEQAGIRMKDALLEISKKYLDRKVLIISHSGAIRALHLTGQIKDQNTNVVVGQDLKFGEVVMLKCDGNNIVKV